MKKLVLFLAVLIGFTGCIGVDHATVIDVDKGGFASGQYKDVRAGQTGTFALAGSGAGWSQGGPGGFGVGALVISSGPSQGSPYDFARSVAMINYSRKLKTIKYDESGGILEYEFSDAPMSKLEYGPSTQKMPTSFGHQPVQ